MQVISKKGKAQLLNGVEKLSALVEQGLEPTDALVKVAQELRVPPNFVELMARAYNIGKQAEQREGSESVLEKLATFTLADSRAALERLYPDEPVTTPDLDEKTAVAACYSLPPKLPQFSAEPKVAFEKIARAPAPEPLREKKTDHQVKVAEMHHLQRDVESTRQDSVAVRDQLMGKIAEIAHYFKLSPDVRRPWPEVYKRAGLTFGQAGLNVMECVAGEFPEGAARFKKEAAAAMPGPMDRRWCPYNWIEQAIKLAESYIDKRLVYVQTKEAYDAKRAEVVPPSDAPPSQTTGQEAGVLGLISEKRSLGLFDYATVQGLRDVGKSIFSHTAAGKPTQELVEDQLGQLDDPKHDAELRKIRTEAMLQDFLANDDIISGHDPEEVLQHFNEISQLSPRSTNQPAVMRSLLRKRLSAGAHEPFEAAEIANIERTLASNQPSSGVLHAGLFK